ncbi:MAG: MmgE/PrpD family protein [Dehalococcoidia bacterium]|nr:MmgE/PrpD family protein [Dehalococcoidia bacterium]MDW8120146.1 MmgE/PrpD family protein [Chloroflexota bacterium]
MAVAPSLTERLVDRALAVRWEKVPPQAQERVKHLFLDFLGVALGGRGLADSTPAVRRAGQALAKGARGTCTVVGENRRYPPPVAAFLNATFAHSLDFDDTHRESIIHPGAPIFATLLALAEVHHTSGKVFLEAALAGYEVTCRIGIAHGEAVHRRGFHPTATTGVFGAVAAGAHLLGLSPEATLDALGLAGSMASGSLQFIATGGWNKRVHVGLAAHNALYALTLAQSGVRGARQPLEGTYGYLRAYGDGTVDMTRASLGDGDWQVLHTAVKPYPSCRYNHAVIDAIVDLARRYEIDPAEVRRIRVVLPPVGHALVAVPPEQKRRPHTSVEGQFSVYFAAAVALLQKGLTWGSYQRLHDPQVQALMERVCAEADATVEGMGARVTLEGYAGQRWETSIRYPRGEPENPLPWPHLVGKFLDLACTVLPREHADRLLDRVSTVEMEADMASLICLLRPA